jgi:hypothetical protein
MKGALAVRIWMCADQVILLVVSHRLMTNLLLADLQVQLAVRVWHWALHCVWLHLGPWIPQSFDLFTVLWSQVVEELNLGRVQIEMGQAIIRTEMGQVILRTAHLHILMQTERVLARLDEELPHLLGTGEVGTLREGTKALSWRQALPRLVYAQVDDRRSRWEQLLFSGMRKCCDCVSWTYLSGDVVFFPDLVLSVECVGSQRKEVRCPSSELGMWKTRTPETASPWSSRSSRMRRRKVDPCTFPGWIPTSRLLTRIIATASTRISPVPGTTTKNSPAVVR